MKEDRVWYCEVEVVSTVTLETLAPDEEAARANFRNGRFTVFDTVTPVSEAKEFGELRNVSNWQDPDEEQKGE